MKVFEQIKLILTDVLDVENIAIDKNTNSYDIDEWDSLAHINIMISISKQFDIKFSVDEIASLHNVGAIVECVERKLENKQ